MYIFEIKEQAKNIDLYHNTATFNYEPIQCKSMDKMLIKITHNDINILDKHFNPKYKGHLNIEESVFNNSLKLVFDLEPSLTYIGGSLILKKESATLIHNGSGLRFIASYRGSVSRLENPFLI
jgi:hypothetical protein